MSFDAPQIEDGNHEAKPSVELLNKLRELGFTVELQRQVALFSREGEQYSSLRDGYVLPLAELSLLGKQMAIPVKPLAEYFGFMSPATGWFEITVQRIAGRRPRLFEPHLGGIGSFGDGCRHSNGASMPSLDPAKYRTQRDIGTVHVTDNESGVCIEISWSSPCGVLFGVPNGPLTRGEPLRQFLSTTSLKIDFGSAQQENVLLTKAMKLVDSLLFELNVRNRLTIEPVRRAERERGLVRRRLERVETARFPLTSLDREVAELFSFAESARDNPPLAFLSFYQVLEYFFPYAVRRNAIRRVRKEIADPLFVSTSDPAILRILKAAEMTVNASEVTQIGTLISDSIRPEKLEGFFKDDERRAHFGKGGPISGVESINLKNPQKPIAAQVADRIYRIRNRIVHAKDDPKYADVRVLLPKSREAYALGPDIDLVRLLAIEVIIDSQV